MDDDVLLPGRPATMIIDYHADPDHADQHDILDADTFQPLPMEPPWSDIFYADDARGILRYHLRDDQGQFFISYADAPGTRVPDDKLWRRFENGVDVTPEVCSAWREVRRRFRIARKP
jgi:hypothetical protein